MKPLKLKLRKFKGIWSGLGLEEVEQDFEGQRGLVAIIGDNGKGKSTMMQNMHPFRLMPDKVKTFSPKACDIFNETFGRDAQKDFEFLMDGSIYRSLIMIDSEKRKQKAYLYKKSDSGEWQSYGDTQEGNLEPYDLAIEKLVGSPRMFFTSIFRSQKAPSVSSYTRSEMMDIFAELLNIDDLQKKADTASLVADGLGKKRDVKIAEKQQLDSIIRDEATKLTAKAQAEEKVKVIAQEISLIEVEIKKSEDEVKSLEIKLSIQKISLENKERIEKDIVAKSARHTELETSIKEKRALYNVKYKTLGTKKLAAQELAKKVPELTEKVKEEKVKLSEIESLKGQIRTADERYIVLGKDLAVFNETEQQISALEKTLQELKLTQAHTVEMAEKDLITSVEKRNTVEARAIAARELAKKGPELRVKVQEEGAKLSEIASLTSQLTAADERFIVLGKELVAFNETKQQISGLEKTLQELRLTQTHAVEMAEKDLSIAMETAKKLLEVPCADSPMSGICKFVKDAVLCRDSIASLEEAVKKAKEPNPEELNLVKQVEELTVKVAGKIEVEKEAKELEEKKKNLNSARDLLQKGLDDIRETLKGLPQVEEAEKSLPDIEKELIFAIASIASFDSAVKKAKEPNPEELNLVKQVDELKVRVAGKVAVAKEVKEVEERKKSLGVDLDRKEKDLAAIRETLKQLPQAEEAEKSLPDLDKDLAAIFNEGKQVIGEIEKQMSQFTSEIATLNVELSKIAIDETIQKQINEHKETVEGLKKSILLKRDEESVCKVSIGSLTEALSLIDKSKVKLSELLIAITDYDKEISEWKVVAAAMDGIVTLEIDDAGPAVTAITNDILHTCYGPRFSVKIKTQDETANGKAMKEVFDIEVFDAERDAKKSLCDTSGGEETWIEDSIIRGIALFNAERSGKKYHMLFSDEKDGRLTEERRRQLMAVKRRVMELGGFDGEYFISHTKEIQEMADSSINLDEMFPERSEKRQQESSEDEQLILAAA